MSGRLSDGCGGSGNLLRIAQLNNAVAGAMPVELCGVDR